MFARTIQAHCKIVVREARDGDPLEPDQVLLAPDRWHMGIERAGSGFKVMLHDAPPLHGFRPAVDVLFESVAREAGRRAAGFLLTGMGADGARGLYEMRRAGAVTYAQDEATSLVWGMPGAAVALGAADHLIALDDVAAEIQRYRG
jgi:two-component system chemotaxis response regulator CheB